MRSTEASSSAAQPSAVATASGMTSPDSSRLSTSRTSSTSLPGSLPSMSPPPMKRNTSMRLNGLPMPAAPSPLSQETKAHSNSSPSHSSSSPARTPRASSYSSTTSREQNSAAADDPFSSMFGSSAAATSSSGHNQPDFFRQQSRTESPMRMLSEESHQEIPPTPGPSEVGKDHPWAKLFAGGGGGSDRVPPTPGGGWTPGGLLGGGNLSLPGARRSSDSRQQSSSTGSAAVPNGLHGRLRDPRPTSSHSENTRAAAQSTSSNADSSSGQREAKLTSQPIMASTSLPIPGKKSGAGVSNDLNRFRGVDRQTLGTWLTNQDWKDKAQGRPGSILIIDIRPSTSFVAGRVKSSINVCAPSTLLKRPGVTVQKVEDDMLQCEADRLAFARWKKGPTKGKAKEADGVDKIVVVDTDTSSLGDPGRPSVGGGGPCLVGMLRKFDTAGFEGDLYWLVGGFAAFAEHAKNSTAQLVEEGASTQEDEPSNTASGLDADDSTDKGNLIPGRLQLSSRSGSRSSVLSAGSDRSRASSNVSIVQRALPSDAFTNQTTTAQRERSASNQQRSQASGEGAAAGSSTGNSSACNPFFDNIRQNRELQHGITERIPLEVGQMSNSDKEALPPFLWRMVDANQSDRAEKLAQGFFDVEKAEQDRLMSTMRQHTSESGIDPRGPHGQAAQPSGSSSANSDQSSSPPALSLSSSPASSRQSAMQLSSPYCRISDNPSASLSASSFPFSIAAAIERGGENRYNNIWTYEHSRVKVATEDLTPNGSRQDTREGAGSDYLNGSYVEPLREFGCHRRYIATQAPLPSTFETFWRAVWQQNSRTIAMLTREYESGRVQSHNYWSEPSYGTSIKLKVISERELNARGQPCAEAGSSMSSTSVTDGGGFFAEVSKTGSDASKEAVMVLRQIELTYLGADEGPRIINHLQYIGWPDYSIPSDPEALLVFMDLANQCQQESHLALSGGKAPASDGIRWTKETATGPLMLHCSAGVGRTGTYAVIDSVLDVLRRERARRRSVLPLGVWDNGVAVSNLIDGHRQVQAQQDVEMIPAEESASPEDEPSRASRHASFSWGEGSSMRPWPRGGAEMPEQGFDFAGSVSKTPLAPPFSAPTGGVNFLRGIRRSLKRELSPSAHMELDQAEKGFEGGFGSGGRRRSVASPPPLRRNRSNSSEVALSTTSSSDTTDTAESDLALSNEAECGTNDSRSNTASSASHPSSGWNHLGIRQPDGLDTPSRALDGMSLSFQPSPSPANSAAASARASPCPAPSQGGEGATMIGSGPQQQQSQQQSQQQEQQSNSISSGRRGSIAKQMRSSSSTLSPQCAAAASAGSSSGSATSSSSGSGSRDTSTTSPPSSNSPPYAASAFGDVDLVRRATDVAREQRMSSVQTQRQYVFCYSAVIKGVLRESEREAANSA